MLSASISGRRIRYAIILVLLALLVYFLYLTREVLLSFIMGALLAYLLFRPVKWLQGKGIKRSWAIIIIYIVAAGLLALTIIITIPRIINELTGLAKLIPHYASQMENMTGRIDNIAMPEKLNKLVSENVNTIENYIYEGLKNFIRTFYAFLNKILPIIFSPILAFYIINDWEKIRDAFLNLLSPRGRNEAVTIFSKIDNVLVEFLKGHLLVATIVGIAAGIAAAIIGVKFPILIGLIIGVLDLIPYFGPFLGAVPALAVALSQSSRLALYMGIAILVIQQVEGNIITPKIIGERLGMHPLLMVFALLSGGELLGVWGMLVAIPAFAVLRIILSWGYGQLIDSFATIKE